MYLRRTLFCFSFSALIDSRGLFLRDPGSFLPVLTTIRPVPGLLAFFFAVFEGQARTAALPVRFSPLFPESGEPLLQLDGLQSDEI